jgi:hypothetical protein
MRLTRRFALIKSEKRRKKYKIFYVYSIYGQILPVEWRRDKAGTTRAGGEGLQTVANEAYLSAL